MKLADRLARPVVDAATSGRWPSYMTGTAPLEAVCRTLTGLATTLARDDLAQVVGSDVLRFDAKAQSLVEAAFFCHAALRCDALRDAVDGTMIDKLRASRQWEPGVNNWLLFSAIVEAFFKTIGEDWRREPIDRAISHHMDHYAGDGLYPDGFEFHADYYNSFVMHPMMLEVLRATKDEAGYALALRRAQRAAVILERLISPEGAFPPLGRSLAYRVGAFHLLGDLALRRALPPQLPPAQVRCALWAVIDRTMHAPGTFDADGWLTIGFRGEQPAIGEGYINRGSVYLCTTALLPLGLPADDPFWVDPARDWTSKRLYAGEDLPADEALSER